MVYGCSYSTHRSGLTQSLSDFSTGDDISHDIGPPNQVYSWNLLQVYTFDLGPQNFKWRFIATLWLTLS